MAVVEAKSEPVMVIDEDLDKVCDAVDDEVMLADPLKVCV